MAEGAAEPNGAWQMGNNEGHLAHSPRRCRPCAVEQKGHPGTRRHDGGTGGRYSG